MKSDFEFFKGEVRDAKDGDIDACVGLLFIIIISPFLLIGIVLKYMFRDIMRIVAYLIYKVIKLFEGEKWQV